MKNLISFLTLTAFLFFVSCAKEEIPQPKITPESIGATWNVLDTGASEEEAAERSMVLQISVEKVSVQLISGVLETTLSSVYDLTGVELEAVQYLHFTDASGNTVILTMGVNYYLGSNGQLEADFAIGGNNLTGLTLKETQDIIIEEDIFN